MIEDQQKPFKEFGPIENLTEEEAAIAIGAQILKATLDFDQLIHKRISHKGALSTLRKQTEEYNSRVVQALETFRIKRTEEVVKMVKVEELDTLMILEEDVRDRKGLLLVSKGQKVNLPVIVRLRNYSQGVGVVEPFRVRMVSPEEWEDS